MEEGRFNDIEKSGVHIHQQHIEPCLQCGLVHVVPADIHGQHNDQKSSSNSMNTTGHTHRAFNPMAEPYKPLAKTQFNEALRSTETPLSTRNHENHDSPEDWKSTISVQTSSTASKRSRATSDVCWAPDPRVLSKKAHSWKSPSTKLNAEYQRVRKLVGFIAPEQFRDPAKPTDSSCDIVPTSVQEYVMHRKEVAEMARKQMQKNIELMKIQIEIRQVQGRIRSVFGKGGRIFESGLSPVLARPTIWSAEYKNLNLPAANWPTRSELQVDGDHREQLKTKCGRFLPAPRMPAISDASSDELCFLPAFPFDQTGPIYWGGPSPLEVLENNSAMNHDAGFKEKGGMLLGAGLLKEIGYETNNDLGGSLIA